MEIAKEYLVLWKTWHGQDTKSLNNMPPECLSFSLAFGDGNLWVFQRSILWCDGFVFIMKWFLH